MRRLAFLAVGVLAVGLLTPSPAAAGVSGPAAHRRPVAAPTSPAPPRPASLRPRERVVTGAVARPAQARTGAGLAVGARTLVLYDTTGPYGWLGEMYAVQVANLASHFGAWTAHPVAGYVGGELSGYTAVVYVGSTYDEPVPTAFLDDVLATTVPVVWAYDNIWQLNARHGAFADAYGFTWRQFDLSPVAQVRYKQTSLTRSTLNEAGIMDHVVTDPTRARVLADAVRPDGTTFPWAIRSGRLTYVGEIPFAYVTHDDRYLAFADLMFDALAPATATRHRALVRIEDVGPTANPNDLKAVADYLSRRRVPFSIGVYPEYRDPLGANSGGIPVVKRMRDAPEVVSAIRYMMSKGGTVIMHGYTHQYDSVANPYNAVSGDDFEFFRSHIDANDYVRYDGPVAEDSAGWAGGRIDAAYAEFAAANLPRPAIFEFPHYAGSATDYAVAADKVGTRYDRGLYFPGVLTGGVVDHSRIVGQFFPYSVRDAYGSAVIPENLGNVSPEEYNHNPPRFPDDILASARRNLVVRDGVASFFYHPYLGRPYLRTIVEGMQTMGYVFVPASASLA
jgi:uncharacterized protein YdaL